MTIKRARALVALLLCAPLAAYVGAYAAGPGSGPEAAAQTVTTTSARTATPTATPTASRGYDAVSAREAWTLNCMGCHTGDAHGIAGKVPPLTGAMGHFVRVAEGREFVMRVPGASNSSLSDAELANVLNWLIDTKNADSRPADFRPYTAQEVAAKRRPALTDVAKHRAALIDMLHKNGDTAVAQQY